VVFPEPDSPTRPTVPAGDAERHLAHGDQRFRGEPAGAQAELLAQALRFDEVGAGRRALERSARRRGAAHEVVDHRQPPGPRVEARPAGEQRARIRVARRIEYALRRPAFAHLTLAHHHHVVGDLADQPEVVADEQHAHAVALAQPRDQLEHLALHRDVERGGRLVGDQQLRLVRDGHRDHHALLLAARELVRIGAQARPRLGNPHLGEQLGGPLERLTRVHPAMQA